LRTGQATHLLFVFNLALISPTLLKRRTNNSQQQVQPSRYTTLTTN
jgi:hypothetical protein